MFSNNRKSQAGFSLVELMVVVAIIGVLASIAVPSINKYLAKARQTEAKTQLSALYTSEKAFYAEYTAYDARFAAVGYSPEGQLRYNVGFSAAHMVAGTNNGYNSNVPAGAPFNAVAYCAVANSGCTMLVGATGVAAPAVTGTSGSNAPGQFVAEAAAQISSATGAAIDRWTINELKVFNNTSNGIP